MNDPAYMDSAALDSLMGHAITSWGRDHDGVGTHFVLDDGRVLIVVGLIAVVSEHVVH